MRIDGRALFAIAFLFTAWIGTSAQVVRPVEDLEADLFHHGPAALDDVGTVVYAASSADPVGTNPRHAPQIVKWTLPGGGRSQLTDFAEGIGRSVSVSDDGQWLAFISTSNPLGVNHDESLELFVMRTDGTELAQLTNDPAPNAGRVSSAMISGSGNRVVFVANTDPLGTNASHYYQVFIVDRDGSNLRQLTNSSAVFSTFSGVSLSDNGNRVVFGHDSDANGSTEIFAVNANGTGLQQVTVGGSSWSMFGPVISGDGSLIAFSYYEGPGPGDDYHVKVISYPPHVIILWQGEGSSPSLTDNGMVLYFTRNFGLYVRDFAANTTTLLSSHPVKNASPVVSGSGNRVVFRTYNGAYPGGDNPDGGDELMVMDASGSNIQQLTLNQTQGFDYMVEPQLTADGTRVVFLARAHGGDAASDHLNLYRVQADGSDRVRLTAVTNNDIRWPTVAEDGNTIVFMTPADLTGQNPPNGGMQVFRVLADGTGLLQLTPGGFTADPPEGWDPVISADGSVVVFETYGGRLFRVAPDGSGLAQILDDDSTYWKYPRVSATGGWVVFQSQTNLDGANADGSQEVFRVRSDGTGLQRLTADPNPQYGSGTPDISADGERIVYLSSADPLGTNADHNPEIFVYEPATSTRVQLTSTTGGPYVGGGVPRISANGAYVYFVSRASLFESLPAADNEDWNVYRVAVSTGQVERAGALRDVRGSLNNASPSYWNSYPTVDASGARAVYVGPVNATDENPDLNPQLWLVDWLTPARIQVGKASPTLVSWDAEPRPVRYDVIRGDVANLQLGPGDTVDLGAVVCLEDDSPDSHIVGFEDSAQPVPGQALFFLYRGTQGLADGPGSWGQGSGGRERIAGAGSCQP